MKASIKNWSLPLLIAALGLMLAIAANGAQKRQTLRDHVPTAARKLAALGRLPATTNLNLAIALPLRNQEALTNLLREIYDPASPNYHHYLTPEQFAEKFGPTKEDYEAVIKFAERNGLRVTGRHPNRVILEVSSTVEDAEKAFHVKMQTYRHPKEAREFYAPATEPTVDLDVPLMGISGLDNYSLPRPLLRTNALSLASNNAQLLTGSGPSGTYMGNDFRAAYLPGCTLTGAGQSVGLVEFDGYTASDITYYENKAGLPHVRLTNVLVGVYDEPSGGGGQVEVSLDIEMAISMAPGLAGVIVYEGRDWSSLLNRIATDNLAKQVSCSWVSPGMSPDPTLDAIFQQMAAQGQSFYNASGDHDAFTGTVDFPDDNPYITQVGGTTLTTSGPGGARVSETVWNSGGGMGSGGGISTYYSIPDWQQGIDMTANQGSTTFRNIPDVAMVAYDIYVRANSSDNSVMGTSCSAPLWAGMTALMNQLAVNNGLPAVGLINQQVYACGQGAGYTNAFYDITIGNNESPSSPSNFVATSGYDLCTGWGTPAGTNLLYAIALPDTLLRICPLAECCTFSGPRGGPFVPATANISLFNAGLTALSWSLCNTSVWLNVSLTSGTLNPGELVTNVELSVSPAANLLTNGIYTGTIFFTNLTDQSVQSRTFTLRVGLDYSYVLNDDGGITITSYDGPLGVVDIPRTIDGLLVTRIGNWAFSAGGCERSPKTWGINSVTIPDSVISIGDFAFYWVYGLTNITIPGSVTNIGIAAFGRCQLTDLTIPSSNVSIGDYAFEESWKLNSVSIGTNDTSGGTNVISIGNCAFMLCDVLTSVTIGNRTENSVANIGTDAFLYNYSLTNVSIVSSVANVGDWAFFGCSQLASVTMGIDATSMGRNVFYSCPNLASVIMGADVNISIGAFAGQTSLTRVTMGSGIWTGTNATGNIGNSAFKGCIGLARITIPNSVTNIGNSAFSGCSSLTNASIGTNVISIGSSAFQDCFRLTSIIIPDSVTIIGTDAFRGCTGLISITIPGNVANLSGFQGCTGLTSITIPDSVTNIGTFAFLNCSGLVNVSIGTNVTSIGTSAFRGCTGLTSITIPDSVTSIGVSAFSGCINLASITIPDSVTSIGTSAFQGCTSLTSITIPDSVTGIGSYAFSGCSSLTSASIGANVNSIGTYAFYNCIGLSSMTIPDSVTSIGSYAFSGCSSLISASIGTNVTSIGTSMFRNCTNLSSITIPDSVTNIGGSAFYGCSSLTNASIGTNVTSIGSSAFRNCFSLTSITIPGSVTNIGSYAFYNCVLLTSLYFNGNAPTVGTNAFETGTITVAYYYSGSSGWGLTIAGISTVVLNPPDGSLQVVITPAGALTAGAQWRADGGVLQPGGTILSGLSEGDHTVSFTTVSGWGPTPPDQIVSISSDSSTTVMGNYLFSYSITNGTIAITRYWGTGGALVIPDTIDGLLVTGIGINAFLGRISLTSITIPNGILSIGGNAFSGCSALTNVTIGNSVTSIGNSAFYGCSGLTSIAIPDSIMNIGDYAFVYCTSLGAITVDTNSPYFSSLDGVLFDKNQTTLIRYPWAKAGSSYSIPSSVTSIDDYAFYNCTNLNSIIIPDKVTNIGNSAFQSCTSLASISIGTNVTTIGNYAFQGCVNLTSIIIPDSVTTIGDSVFSGCTGLNSISIGTNVTSIGSYAFQGSINLTSITIPDSVTDIGEQAFNGCIGLTSISIGNHITRIEDYAFQNCTRLASVIIGNSVTNIGTAAFYNCPSLANITIPNSVIGIQDQAFLGCSSLTNVLLGTHIVDIANYAFQDCVGLTRITIPASLKSIGIRAFVGCDSLNIFVFLGNAPTVDLGDADPEEGFGGGDFSIIYYRRGTSGWGSWWHGLEAVAVSSFNINVKVKGPLKTAGAVGNPPLVISGTASGGFQVSRVLIGLDGGLATNVATFTGGSGVNTNWSYTWTPPPAPGNHTVSVKGVDDALALESAAVSNTFFYQVYVPLTIVTNTDGIASSGGGKLTPTRSSIGTPTNGAPLVVGKSYTLTAVPTPNIIFSNWVSVVDGVSSVLTTNNKVTFPMQSNLTLIANFITNRFTTVAGTYYGLFYETNGVTPQSAGFIKVTVTARLTKPASLSGTLTLAGETVRFSGSFDLSGDATIPLAFSFANVTMRLHLPFDGGDTLSGAVSNIDNSWTAELIGNRAVFKASNPATAYAGLYTMLIPGSTNAAEAPGGNGYGTINVASNGTISLSGNLGDGFVLKQSVPVSRSGDWPFYCPASTRTSTNANVVMGWLSFRNGLGGTVTWIKSPVSGDVFYPDGFTNQTDILASRYNKPGNGVRVIALANGTGSLLLSGGNLSDVLSNNVMLTTLNKFKSGTNYGLSLKVATATGKLTGAFTNAATGNFGTLLTGVVLKELNRGGGYFLGTNQTGAFQLQGN